MSITYKIYDKKPSMEGISGNNVLSLRKHFSDIEVPSRHMIYIHRISYEYSLYY